MSSFTQERLVGEPDAVLERGRGAPAEFCQPADIEQLAYKPQQGVGLQAKRLQHFLLLVGQVPVQSVLEQLLVIGEAAQNSDACSGSPVWPTTSASNARVPSRLLGPQSVNRQTSGSWA